jgi:hypothetical protein
VLHILKNPNYLMFLIYHCFKKSGYDSMRNRVKVLEYLIPIMFIVNRHPLHQYKMFRLLIHKMVKSREMKMVTICRSFHDV